MQFFSLNQLVFAKLKIFVVKNFNQYFLTRPKFEKLFYLLTLG